MSGAIVAGLHEAKEIATRASLLQAGLFGAGYRLIPCQCVFQNMPGQTCAFDP
jgi:hypothetical protein